VPSGRTGLVTPRGRGRSSLPILTQHNEDAGQVVIDSHANGSEETSGAAYRKCSVCRTARPGIKVKGGTYKGTGGQTLIEKRLDEATSEVKIL
jgi:hypothetical protein